MDTPRASAESVKLFVDTFDMCQFSHADELVPLMRRNDVNEIRITCHEMRLDDRLRRVYRFRANHLASTLPSPYYPPGLADDVRDLADQLDAASDQEIRLWNALLGSGLVYLVFELLDDKRVGGCVKSADQRIANPSAW